MPSKLLNIPQRASSLDDFSWHDSAGPLRLDVRKLIPNTFGQQHGRSRFLMQSRSTGGMHFAIG
jgi:hypothetical protein